MDLTATVCATSSAAAACKPLRHHFDSLVAAENAGRPLSVPLAAISAAISAIERATESAAAAASAAAAGYAAEISAAAAATRDAERRCRDASKDQSRSASRNDMRGRDADAAAESHETLAPISSAICNEECGPPLLKREDPVSPRSEPCIQNDIHDHEKEEPRRSEQIAPLFHSGETRDQMFPRVFPCATPATQNMFGSTESEIKTRIPAETLRSVPSTYGRTAVDGNGNPMNSDGATRLNERALNGMIDHSLVTPRSAHPLSPAEPGGGGEVRGTIDHRIHLLRHFLKDPNNPVPLPPYHVTPNVPTVLGRRRSVDDQPASSEEELSQNTKDESSGSEYVANSTDDSDDSCRSRRARAHGSTDTAQEVDRDTDVRGDGSAPNSTERWKQFRKYDRAISGAEDGAAVERPSTASGSKQSPKGQCVQLTPHPLVERHGTIENAIDSVPESMQGMELVPGMTIRASVLFEFMHRLANDVYGEMLEAVLALQTSQYWSLRCHRHGKAPKSCGRVKSKSKKCNCGWRVCMRVINEQETIAAKQRAPAEDEREAQIRAAVLRINSFYPNHTGHEPEPYLRGPGIAPVRKRREHPVPLPITATRARR